MKTFKRIKPGDHASSKRTLTKKDILLFARSSGDTNPIHLNAAFAKKSIFKKEIAHGMWTAALISAVLGKKLPGPGSIYLNQTLQFHRPVYIGDTITTRLVVIKKYVRKPIILLSCQCLNQKKVIVLSGIAKVMVPF